MRSPILNIMYLLIGAFLFVPAAFAQATVPGYTVQTYASVSDPVTLSFAPNGDLYVGRDLSGSGSGAGDATRIHRVLAGGLVVEEFGSNIGDPDAVLFDATGLIAPSANSVLVGSRVSMTQGMISAIASDGSVTSVFGVTTAFNNPTDMVFDGSGRLVFTDFNNANVKATTGGAPTLLFSIASETLGLAYDPGTDRLYTSGLDGTIRAHLSNGTLIDSTFGTGRSITVGQGSVGFGTDVYTVDNETGELFRIDSAGNATMMGSGFVGVADLAFGPDGALYVSEFDDDRILRIALPGPGVPAMSKLGLSVLALLFLIVASAVIFQRRPAAA